MRRIFGESAAPAMTALPSLLFRPAAFFVRMCRANEWWRLTLPVAVILKRLAAPLCVFSFMSSCSLCRSLLHLRGGSFLFFPSFLFLGRKYCDQIRPFHLGSRVHNTKVC